MVRRSIAACLMIAGICIAGLLPVERTGAAPSCAAPVQRDDGWPVASPEAAGFDAAILCALEDTLDGAQEMNIHAVVVARNGALVYETYRSGRDSRWGTDRGTVKHAYDKLHDLRSISKSVVSLLIGIAIDRKLIGSVEESVLGFFPDLSDLRTPEKGRIRLADLLTMTSGIAWDETLPYSNPRNGERQMIGSGDPYRFVLEQDIAKPPGAAWNYSGGNTQLLAGVLQKATGQKLEDFARETLFAPLGIVTYEWLRMPASGEAAAASGLRLLPRDMAKIGALVLAKGMWQGRRIVSEAWIDESTNPRIRNIDPIASLGYGYQWWGDHERRGTREVSWVSAQGLGGQRIYVVPAYGLVVVITAGLYADESQNFVPYSLFEKHVLAAIRE